MTDLATQAGLAFKNLRLTEELQAYLIQLKESRKRIVAAQDFERKRMERDIHDGAQQQLVAMSVKLSLAQAFVKKDPTKARSIVQQLKSETADAVDSLRALARGIFPPLLSEAGLGTAIRSHLEKLGMDASVEDRTSGARYAPEVEAAVYFAIREAIQNASKHAPGSRIVVHLTSSQGRLTFSVTDEGTGFDMGRTKYGLGLQNMRDRIEAAGGEFRIRSSPGRGTTVDGRMPAPVLEPAG